MGKNESVHDRLRALAQDASKRPISAQLMDVIDDVEAALAAGVSRADVVTALNESGLTISLNTFNTTLTRIRKRRGVKVAQVERPRAAPSPVSQASALSAEPVESEEIETVEESKPEGSHNPSDLDSIIKSKPDLAALARHNRKRKGK